MTTALKPHDTIVTKPRETTTRKPASQEDDDASTATLAEEDSKDKDGTGKVRLTMCWLKEEPGSIDVASEMIIHVLKYYKTIECRP